MHDPLRLELLSARACRLPSLVALGTTALTRVRADSGTSASGTVFEALVHQMNAALFVRRHVCGDAPPSAVPAAASLEESVQRIKGGGSLGASALRASSWPFLVLLLMLRLLCSVAVAVLQWRVPRGVLFIGGASLYDKSALARQLHLRIRDYCGWPAQLLRLRRMRWDVATGRRWHSADALFAQTQAWHDMLWRFVFDYLTGIAACLLLTYSPALVALVLHAIHTFGQILHIDVLRTWIDWLMGLPAGLKLNHFAGRKLGGAVLAFIHFWEYITTYLTPWEPVIVVAVGLVGLGGCSLLLAMTSDVLELATVHIYTLYAQFAWLHSKQVGLLSSLWKLFRGKKRNVLRARVDSNDFDMPQLLLGTLCFTVVFFLFPTTLVYYAFFVIVYLGIQAVHGVLWWLTTLVNNVPLYTIYCLLFSRHQLPAGIRLSLLQTQLPPRSCRRRVTSTLAVVRAAVPGRLEEHDSDLEEEAAAAATGAQAPPPPSGTIWLRLHPSPASMGLALAPLLQAIGVVMQRYSVGVLLKTIIWGEPGLSLFRSVDFGVVGAKASAGAGAAAATAIAATGISFGYVNNAANAPTDAPASHFTGGSNGQAAPGGAMATASSSSSMPVASSKASKVRGASSEAAAAAADQDSRHVVPSCADFWSQLVFLTDVLCFDTDV